MTNMTNSFEKMHDLIGDTTNMSYEEYVEKMFKASIKINSKSEKVDLKELIDMKEVAEQLMIERAINKSIEKATGRKFDGFSIKNELNFNEIDSLSNAANYILENGNNNGEDVKVGVKYNVKFYGVPVLNKYSDFNNEVKINTATLEVKFNSKEEIQDSIIECKKINFSSKYYIMAMELTPIEKYDADGNLNKTVRIALDQEAMLKCFAILFKKYIKDNTEEFIEKSVEALLKENKSFYKVKS